MLKNAPLYRPPAGTTGAAAGKGHAEWRRDFNGKLPSHTGQFLK